MSALQVGGDLGDPPLWEPSVQVRLALTDAGSLRGIGITARWTGAFTGEVSGTTNPTGKVTFAAPAIGEDTLTFTILAVTDAAYEYRPELNAATQVTVTRADAN